MIPSQRMSAPQEVIPAAMAWANIGPDSRVSIPTRTWTGSASPSKVCATATPSLNANSARHRFLSHRSPNAVGAEQFLFSHERILAWWEVAGRVARGPDHLASSQLSPTPTSATTGTARA